MPGKVIIVHDNKKFLSDLTAATAAAGFMPIACENTMIALELLDTSHDFTLLITRIAYASGFPHGLSLALIARRKIIGLKVLFVGRPELAEYVSDIGDFLPFPIEANCVIAKIKSMTERVQRAIVK